MSASFPFSIKQFTTFQDQPGPDALTIDFAADTNEIHDEVEAIETTLGPRPLQGTVYKTFNAAFSDLYNFKASVTHIHPHSDTTHPDTDDDHPQYMKVSGRAFTAPVPGVAGTLPNHLATRTQVTGAGFETSALLTTAINTAFGSKVVGQPSPSFPLAGATASRNWGLVGGVHIDTTNSAGQTFIDFGPAFTQCVQSLVIVRQPFGGFGAYSYRVDKIAIIACSLRGALVQFMDNAGVFRNRGLVIIWVAIGV